MKTIIQSEAAAVGKVVASVADFDAYLAVTFTDNTALVYESEGYDDGQASQYLRREAPSDALTCNYLGLTSDEEYEVVHQKELADERARQEEFERQQYEKLRAKFESLPVRQAEDAVARDGE